MDEKESGKYGGFDSKGYEYDFGPSDFTAEIADREMDAVLDDIFDEAFGKQDNAR